MWIMVNRTGKYGIVFTLFRQSSAIGSKMNRFFLLLSACLTTVLTQSDDFTIQEVQDLKRSIIDGVFSVPGQEDLGPGALRLAFHDCVGGCDGCVNLQNPGNFGLGPVMAALNALHDATFPYGPNQKRMSRADWYNLAGIAEVENGININNNICPDPPACEMSPLNIRFQTGRIDCPTSPDTSVDVGLPGGNFDYVALYDFWSSRFGFDEREMTAIMGAHTLGNMEKDNSGYTGDWKVNDKFSFNNNYYKLLLDQSLDWENFDASVSGPPDERAPGDKWMWRGFDPATPDDDVTFMINVDVDLVLDLDTINDQEGGQSQCDFDNRVCPNSPVRGISQEYADNPDAWLTDFGCAFEKMTSFGTGTLKMPIGDQPTQPRQVTCTRPPPAMKKFPL